MEKPTGRGWMFKTLIRVLSPSVGWDSHWVNWQNVFPRRLHSTGEQRNQDKVRLLFTVSTWKEVMDREMDEVRIKGWVSGSMNCFLLCPCDQLQSPLLLPLALTKVVILLLHTGMSGGILVCWYDEERQRYINVIVLCMHRSVGLERFLRADPKQDWHGWNLETSSGLNHICKKSVNWKLSKTGACSSDTDHDSAQMVEVVEIQRTVFL